LVRFWFQKSETNWTEPDRTGSVPSFNPSSNLGIKGLFFLLKSYSSIFNFSHSQLSPPSLFAHISLILLLLLSPTTNSPLPRLLTFPTCWISHQFYVSELWSCLFTRLTKEEQLGFQAGKAFSCYLLSSFTSFLDEISLENYSFVLL